MGIYDIFKKELHIGYEYMERSRLRNQCRGWVILTGYIFKYGPCIKVWPVFFVLYDGGFFRENS